VPTGRRLRNLGSEATCAGRGRFISAREQAPAKPGRLNRARRQTSRSQGSVRMRRARDELLATAQDGVSDEKHPTRRMAPEAVGAVRHVTQGPTMSSLHPLQPPPFLTERPGSSRGRTQIGGPAAAGNLRTPHPVHRLFLTLQARPHRIPASGVARDARVVRTEQAVPCPCRAVQKEPRSRLRPVHGRPERVDITAPS
jgi:hypothetical protein